MSYGSTLRAKQLLKNWPASRPIPSDVVDAAIEAEERRINRGRSICPKCMTQRSTSGSCFC